MPKGLILIPARYGSTRFPGKPLAKINGVPMIVRVAQNCLATGVRSVVVTDDQRIVSCLDEYGIESVVADEEVETGSQRIFLGLKKIAKNEDLDFVINVQGDEPLLAAADLISLIDASMSSDFSVLTLTKRRQHSSRDDFSNPNIVKIAYSESSNECHYFSRSPIPYDREGLGGEWFQHVGVYLYKADSLEKFCSLPVSPLEDREKLEQLRLLEMGMRIGAVEIKSKLIGVDTPEDIMKVEEVLRESN